MNINYIKLLNLFDKQKLSLNWSYSDIIKQTLFEELYKALKNNTNTWICDDRDCSYDMYGYFAFNFYTETIADISTSFKDIILDKIIYFEEDYKKVSGFDSTYDIDRMSDYPQYNDIDGTAFEKYIGCILLEYFELYQGIQEEYNIEMEKQAALKIESFFLESYYNPRTILGQKRFDKEFNKLIN